MEDGGRGCRAQRWISVVTIDALSKRAQTISSFFVLTALASNGVYTTYSMGYAVWEVLCYTSTVQWRVLHATAYRHNCVLHYQTHKDMLMVIN